MALSSDCPYCVTSVLCPPQWTRSDHFTHLMWETWWIEIRDNFDHKLCQL